MKRVFFICVGNSARSQMAEAFFNSLSPEGWRASSCGTQPASHISSKTIEVMREVGVHLDNKTPKLLTEEMTEEALKIITMGCLDDASCPSFLKRDRSKIEDWNIPDPRGLPLDEYREVRDIIRSKVEELIAEIAE